MSEFESVESVAEWSKARWRDESAIIRLPLANSRLRWSIDETTGAVGSNPTGLHYLLSLTEPSR